jgi:hypothetical protein
MKVGDHTQFRFKGSVIPKKIWKPHYSESDTSVFHYTLVNNFLIYAVPTLRHSVLLLATGHSRDDTSTFTVRKDTSVVAICVRDTLMGH